LGLAHHTALPYDELVHTVALTSSFEAAAKAARLTQAELDAAIDMVAENPRGGAVVQGTGGIRKVRMAGRGRGKSGGYRVVWWFGGDDIPVFLITVFEKGEKDNLTMAERNALRGLTTYLRNSLVD
jgi:hypothetical protein